MTLDLLRKAVPKSLVNRLWQQAREDQCHAGRRCPACPHQMAEVPIIPAENKTVCLEVCTKCYFVWFDPHEFETLPKLRQVPPDFEGLSDEARKALALARLEVLRQEQPLPETATVERSTRWSIAAFEAIFILLDILFG